MSHPQTIFGPNGMPFDRCPPPLSSLNMYRGPNNAPPDMNERGPTLRTVTVCGYCVGEDRPLQDEKMCFLRDALVYAQAVESAQASRDKRSRDDRFCVMAKMSENIGALADMIKQMDALGYIAQFPEKDKIIKAVDDLLKVRTSNFSNPLKRPEGKEENTVEVACQDR